MGVKTSFVHGQAMRSTVSSRMSKCPEALDHLSGRLAAASRAACQHRRSSGSWMFLSPLDYRVLPIQTSRSYLTNASTADVPQSSPMSTSMAVKDLPLARSPMQPP